MKTPLLAVLMLYPGLLLIWWQSRAIERSIKEQTAGVAALLEATHQAEKASLLTAAQVERLRTWTAMEAAKKAQGEILVRNVRKGMDAEDGIFEAKKSGDADEIKSAEQSANRIKEENEQAGKSLRDAVEEDYAAESAVKALRTDGVNPGADVWSKPPHPPE